MTLDNFKRMSFSRQGDTFPFCYTVLLPPSLVIPTNIVRLFKERRKKKSKYLHKKKKSVLEVTYKVLVASLKLTPETAGLLVNKAL